MKKLFSVVLILALLLGTFTSAAVYPDKDMIKLENLSNTIGTNITSLSLNPSADGLKDSDEVRVIVELKDKPLIEYATAEGKRVKDFDKVKASKIKGNLISAQARVKNAIKGNNIKFEELNGFTTVANGFSGKTSFGEAKKIETLEGVKKVHLVNEYSRPEPNMTTSKDIVQAIETWDNLGYDGEGMVVAIIDTGIDPSHKDMVLTNSNEAKLQVEDVESILNEKDLPGTFRTIKVPYGYNYMDNNQEILDLGPDASRHGMHVAGITGANGDEENGGIKGVAPEAQLLAMKVFGNNPAMPSTFGDVIVKAIEDSVTLGADVINMSLGSTASYVMEDDLEQVAIKRATENGVLNSISSGNSAFFGNGYDGPMNSNPDIGVVGSPGLAGDSIQVASIENTYMTAEALEYIYDGETKLAGYYASGPDPITTFNRPVEYVDAKLGLVGTMSDGTVVNDFQGSNVEGKIALIKRGGYDGISGNFTDKISNAEANGAIGVIVWNHESGGEELVSMMYPEGGTIPAVFIQNSHGQNLINLLQTGGNFVEFKGKASSVPNPNSGKLAASSSWGVTPNLDFKPEITAPGAQIWSTDQNNKYQAMSGTSMAAPHVSGGSALVLQRVDELWPGLSGRKRVEMAKNLLMSTAKVHREAELFNDFYGTGIPTSPRRQGAGVMDLYAAGTTPAIAYDSNTKISKVNLKEMNDKTTFTVTVENFSDVDVTYNVSGTVGTTVDNTYAGYGYFPVEANMIMNATTGEMPITFNTENNLITVLANSTVSFDATIDLTNTVDWFYGAPLNLVYPNGNFVEGFISLTDVNDNAPELSIPYLGFYGEWDKAPIIDDSVYDENGSSFYGYTLMMDEKTNFLGIVGEDEEGNLLFDSSKIAFSPNGDGVRDGVQPLLSFLRNAREMDINILNYNGEKVRDLYNEEYVRKDYYDRGNGSMYKYKNDWIWDGTINNNLAVDGEYFYEINTVIDYPNAQWQTVTFPVRVDTTAPIIESVKYDSETKVLTATANDGNYPIDSYVLIENGVVITESLDGVFDLSEVNYSHKAYLRVYDYVGNMTNMKLESVFMGDSNTVSVEPSEPTEPQKPTTPVEYTEPVGPAEGDVTIPTVMVNTPNFFGTYSVSDLTVSGTIYDSSSIESFKVNGIDTPFTFNTQTGKWEFATVVTLEDGYHSINIEAMDSAGNKIAFGHKVFVDTTAPVINMTEEPVEDTKGESIKLSALITDNLPSLKVMVNGNMVTNIAPDWSYFNDLPSAEYTLSYDVALDYGVNTILIEAYDDAGNVTVREYKVNRIKN